MLYYGSTQRGNHFFYPPLEKSYWKCPHSSISSLTFFAPLRPRFGEENSGPAAHREEDCGVP